MDDDTIAAWKATAAENQRSLAAELRIALTELGKAKQREAFKAKAAEIRASSDWSKMDKEAWELIREDRDTR